MNHIQYWTNFTCKGPKSDGDLDSQVDHTWRVVKEFYTRMNSHFQKQSQEQMKLLLEEEHRKKDLKKKDPKRSKQKKKTTVESQMPIKNSSTSTQKPQHSEQQNAPPMEKLEDTN